MNRREFLKKGLEGIVISILFISCCGKNPVDSKYELEGVYIDKELVADGIGNYDGVASKTELDEIDNYFKSNIEAWGLVGGFPETYLNKNEIPISEVINELNKRLYGPFKSEAELRNFMGGTFIRWYQFRFGIFVFVSENNKSNQYRLKYIFKCFGALNNTKGELIPMIVNKE